MLANYLFIVLATYLFIALATYLFIALATYLFIALATYLFIVLAINLFIALAHFKAPCIDIHSDAPPYNLRLRPPFLCSTLKIIPLLIPCSLVM